MKILTKKQHKSNPTVTKRNYNNSIFIKKQNKRIYKFMKKSVDNWYTMYYNVKCSLREKFLETNKLIMSAISSVGRAPDS